MTATSTIPTDVPPSKSRKVILYIATSLDGFIARENGDVDWLPVIDPGKTNADEDYGYAEFCKTIDTVLMGRTTYEQTLTFGEFPYKDKKCYVFSQTVERRDPFVEFIHGDIRHFVESLQQKKGADIWLVGGSKIIDAFLKDGLIDECIVTIIPTLLGQGIPLFMRRMTEVKLFLRECLTYPSGLVQLHYVLTGIRGRRD